ncbi:MAG: hypothetical protein AAGH92_07360 [Planctomycetota bacterium]
MAKGAYRRGKELEDGSGEAGDEAITAIVSSCICLEAWCQEVGDQAVSQIINPDGTSVAASTRSLASVWPQLGRLGGKNLIVAVRALLPGDDIDLDSQPGQDLSFLFTLRNAIVHLKPESTTRPQKAIIGGLQSRGIYTAPQRHLADHFFWLDCMNTHRVSEWACQTVINVLSHFARGWGRGEAGFHGKLESKLRHNFRIYEDWRPLKVGTKPASRPDNF